MEFNEGPKTPRSRPGRSPLRLASGPLRASLGGTSGSLRGPFIEFHFPDDVIVRLFAGAADLEICAKTFMSILSCQNELAIRH